MLAPLLSLLKWLLLAFAACVVILFAINNRAAITVSLFPLPFEVDAPLFLLTILTFALGLLAGGTSLSLKLLRTKRKLAEQRNRSQALENEVQALRNEANARESLPLAVPAPLAEA